MTRLAALATLALAILAVWMLVLVGAPSPSNNAHATSQVALTASYSIIGGSGLDVADVLTYISGGSQQVVALTGSPTVYMVDMGSEWSAQTILNGSTYTERWITTQDVSGTIAAPLTVAFSYYHQYLITFNFDVTNGGAGFSDPSVSFDQLGAPVASVAPEHVWVDASSPYAYSSQLPGSTSSERWALLSGGSGTINQTAIFVETYYHQYLVSSSFSIVGGGAPTPPSLSSASFESPLQVDMTSSPQGTWFDAGAPYTFTSPLTASGSSPANETWAGTVVVQTQSGSVLSTDNNGTVTGPLSITPVFYHQFLVNVEFNFAGGSPNGLTPPAFTYQYFGAKASVSTSTAVWVDSGTEFTLPETVCCPGSPSSERWELYNSTSGTIDLPTTINSTYFHQYFQLFSYSIVGALPPSPSGQPDLTYLAGGNAQHLALALTGQTFWADANSAYSATSTLSGSNASERWFAPRAIGSIVGPAPNFAGDLAYDQQYLLTLVGGGLPTQWVDAGSNATLNTPGVFGRSAGTGFRAVSYEIDSGSTISITQPGLVIPINLSMNGPHTIQFQSVTQFQLTLDTGAAGAVHSITPPTVPGDNYWYDTGSQVQVVLNGTWGRVNGVGQRITSISATARSTINVDTVGTVQAYSSSSLESPASITTTSVTQYEVVLNSAALAAFSSISPPSSFPNDTFWYNSGSPAVTLVLNGAYSRSAGTGFRTTSWALDSGPVTKLAQTGTFKIVTKAMTTPQFVNATIVTQYLVTLDKGGSSALASITSPTVPLDSGWYDASSPVGVVMNGLWGRASGTGERLAGYSLNGGSEVAVASSGLVGVLNLTKISSPEAITTTVATQYQLTLDKGASSSLFSITPTPIPLDKYWYDGGTSVKVSLDGVWGRTSTTGSRLLSYSVNQGAFKSVLSSSPVQVLSVSAMAAPESIATKAASQYHLTSSPVAWVSVTNSTLPGDASGWFDAGANVKAVFSSVWNQTSAGSRESVTSYTVDAAGKTSLTRSGNGTFSISLAMTQAHSISLSSVTQYLFAGVGQLHVTASPPSQTGDSYFDSGSKVTFTVPRDWNGTSGPGTREVLASYSVDGGPTISVPLSNSSDTFTTEALTFTQARSLAVKVATEYQVAFQFFDSLGRNSVEPSLVEIAVGNSTLSVQGPSLWLENGTSFTVVNVTWEGAGVGPTPPPAYEVKAAPLNVTLDTYVYAASLKIVDLFGLPVSGAPVSMTLANGTTITGTTKGDGTFQVGMIPLATYTAKVTSLGTSVQLVGDAGPGQPVTVGKVALSLISLLAVIAAGAVAGSASFLFLRRRKRAKAATGKVSEQK